MNNLIELKLDENNELVFEINIQGTDAPDAKPIVRYIIEDTKMSYTFAGKASGGNVNVDVPVLLDSLKEGIYQSKLEVIIGDRYFVPLQTNVEFKKSLSVTAESITINKKQVISESSPQQQPVEQQPTAVAKIVSHKTKQVSDVDIVTLKQKFKR